MSNKIKMTKADHFGAILTYLDECPGVVFHTPKGDITADQMAEFAEHELGLLSKKNSSEKKPTAQQEANKTIQTAILSAMESGKLYTITDLIKVVPECADLTNQRVSALVRQMKESGLVERVEDKRKAYFRKVEA